MSWMPTSSMSYLRTPALVGAQHKQNLAHLRKVSEFICSMKDIFKQISMELAEAEIKAKSLAKSLIFVETSRKKDMR